MVAGSIVLQALSPAPRTSTPSRAVDEVASTLRMRLHFPPPGEIARPRLLAGGLENPDTAELKRHFWAMMWQRFARPLRAVFAIEPETAIFFTCPLFPCLQIV